MTGSCPRIALRRVLISGYTVRLIGSPTRFSIILARGVFKSVLSSRTDVIANSVKVLTDTDLGSAGFNLCRPDNNSTPSVTKGKVTGPVTAVLSTTVVLEFSFSLSGRTSTVRGTITTMLGSKCHAVSVVSRKGRRVKATRVKSGVYRCVGWLTIIARERSFGVEDSAIGGKVRRTPRHSLFGTLKLARRRLSHPLVNIMDSCGRVMPKRVGLSGVARTIGLNITVTKKAPVVIPTVTIYSNVTVKRVNVGCSLMAESLVTSSARTLTVTRRFSKLMVVPGYSGGMPKLLVTTTHIGMPAMFMDNKPVLTKRMGKDGADLSDVFRTMNSCTTKGVGSRSVYRFRGGTYPAYKSYSNVCATGDVGYLARTLNVKLGKGKAVPTICSTEVRLTGRTNVRIVRLMEGGVHPESVVARSTVLGTLAISVTLKYSAGDVLRLPTVTRRVNVSFRVSFTGTVDRGAPGLYRLTPTNRACVRSLGRTNKICTIVGRLGGGKLLRASYVAMAKGAMKRGVTKYRGGGPRIVHPVSGPCDRANKLTMLGKGLTPSKDIMGHSTMYSRVLIRRKPTEVFRDSRRTARTVGAKGVGPKSIVMVHCRKPGNNPKVERVLGPASTVTKCKLKSAMTLVASKEFDKTSENTSVKRMSPRTTINKPVTLMRRKSVVGVGVPRLGLRLSMSSRRLTTEGTG